MARRNIATPIPSQFPSLSFDELKQARSRLRKRIEDMEEFDPSTLSGENLSPTAHAFRASIDEALAKTFGAGTADYRRYELASRFDECLFGVGFGDKITSFKRCQARALALLKEAAKAVEERLGEVGVPILKFNFVEPSTEAGNRRVFVVHGHGTGVREAVARFLEKAGFEPVILHEQANQGRTIIEKFEGHADVSFAVVLLTPDDIGSAVGSEPQSRARQNVILELGYFIGRLGRNRVCALKSGDLELPTDILGVAWVPFDDAGGWRVSLAKELEAADFEIDWNKVMSKS